MHSFPMLSRKWNKILLVCVGATALFIVAALVTTLAGWRPINPGANLLLALAIGLSLIISLTLLLPEE